MTKTQKAVIPLLDKGIQKNIGCPIRKVGHDKKGRSGKVEIVEIGVKPLSLKFRFGRVHPSAAYPLTTLR